jgi:hypothetical protein
VSYALYAGVCVAALALARRLLAPGVALAAALLFAAHPVHVEAVALGVNQSELWVALLAILSALRYVDVRRAGLPKTRDWALLATVYTAACFVKEHALAIPGLLLAAELTVIREPPWRERARRLWPGFAAFAGIGAGFLALRASVLGSFVGSFTADALVGQDVSGRTLTMLQVVPEWLRLLLFPIHLQGDYSTAEIEQATGWGVQQTAGIALLAALAALAWRTKRWAPAVPFGILWAAAAILPVSNILVPTGIVMAERTLFLPSVGFVIAAVGFAAAAWEAWPRCAAGTRKTVAKAAVAVLVSAGVIRSAVRHPDWRDHLHFWERTVADAPLSHKAHHAYGQLLAESQAQEAALREYYLAMALAPAAPRLPREVGDLFRLRGECGPALYWYAESLRLGPNQGSLILSRIACLMQLGRLDEARREAEATVSGEEPRPPP